MSLFNSWENAPKVVTNGKDVRYSAEPDNWTSDDGTVTTALYWNVTRTATMSYKIIGLSKSAAEAAVESLNADYTRPYSRWEPIEIENSGGQPPTILIDRKDVIERSASIQASPVAGDAWEVSVTINDDDKIISLEKLETVKQFEELFQRAAQRDNISNEGSIAITDAHWESKFDLVTVNYNPIIANFDVTLIGVEVYDSVNDTWSSVPTLTTTRRKGYVQFYYNSNVEFRVVYNNSIRSKGFLTMDDPMPDMQAINAQQTSRWQLLYGSSQPTTVLTITIKMTDLADGICAVPSAFSILYKNRSGGWSKVKPQYARNVGEGVWAYESYPILNDFNFADPKAYVTYDLRRIDSTSVVVKSKDYLVLDDPRYVSCAVGVTYATVTFEADMHSDFTSEELSSLRVVMKRPQYNAVAGDITLVSRTAVSGDTSHVVFSFLEDKDERNVGGTVWLACPKTGMSEITSNACSARIELPKLEITSIESFMTSGSRTNYVWRSDQTQIDKTKLHLWQYVNAPRTAIADAFQEINAVTENDGYVNSPVAPGVFKLEYRISEDVSIWSAPFAATGKKYFDFKSFVRLADGRLKVEIDTNGTIADNLGIFTVEQQTYRALTIDPESVTATGFVCEACENPPSGGGFVMSADLTTTGSATMNFVSSCRLPDEEVA